MIHNGCCPSACVNSCQIVLSAKVFKCYLAMQSRFKIALTNIACGQLQWAARGQCLTDLNFSTQKSCDIMSAKSKQQAHVYQPVHWRSPTFSAWRLHSWLFVFGFVTVTQEQCKVTFFWSPFLFNSVKWALWSHRAQSPVFATWCQMGIVSEIPRIYLFIAIVLFTLDIAYYSRYIFRR